MPLLRAASNILRRKQIVLVGLSPSFVCAAEFLRLFSHYHHHGIAFRAGRPLPNRIEKKGWPLVRSCRLFRPCAKVPDADYRGHIIGSGIGQGEDIRWLMDAEGKRVVGVATAPFEKGRV